MKKVIDAFVKDGLTMEYSVLGEGPPILIFHGGHSNCHEEFGYQELLERGYSIITPSRAGYCKTSKEFGEHLDTACKAYLDLLNHLELEKVHVIAISAGGPSGIYFASHYPERVRSLTLQSAVSKEWLTSKDQAYKAAKVLFRPSIERWTWKLIGWMSSRFPALIFKQMASSFSKLPYSEIQKYMREDDIAQFRKMNQRQRSGHGFMIDLSQTSCISEADLQAIQSPTLIVHSKHDNAVPLEHAYYAERQISDSRLCLLDTWGHLIWLGKGAEHLHRELLDFLAQNESDS